MFFIVPCLAQIVNAGRHLLFVRKLDEKGIYDERLPQEKPIKKPNLVTVDPKTIEKLEKELMDFAFEEMKKIDFIKTYTTTEENRCPVIAFNVEDAHPHDVSSILDSFGIAIRSGHHCAEPLHRYLNENATCRVSFSFYNTKEEVEYFIDKLKEVRRILHLGH